MTTDEQMTFPEFAARTFVTREEMDSHWATLRAWQQWIEAAFEKLDRWEDSAMEWMLAHDDGEDAGLTAWLKRYQE